MKHIFVLIFFAIYSFESIAEKPVMVWIDYPPEAKEREISAAIADAKSEIANGKFVLVGAGLEIPDEVGEKVLKKYHISRSSMGCIFSPLAEIYIDTHNKIVESEIEKKYGKEFWSKVRKEISLEESKIEKSNE